MKRQSRAGRINQRVAGRFGEHMVQAELERRGWNTCNLNTDHPNAPGYDILAWKEGARIHVRVKTSRSRRFLFGTKTGGPPSVDVEPNDFTVFVGMGAGEQRNDDEFYVVPTREVREEMAARYKHFITDKRWKDAGLLALVFHTTKDTSTPGENLNRKWECYRNWHSLAATTELSPSG
jgi:hypothetical protein